MRYFFGISLLLVLTGCASRSANTITRDSYPQKQAPQKSTQPAATPAPANSAQGLSSVKASAPSVAITKASSRNLTKAELKAVRMLLPRQKVLDKYSYSVEFANYGRVFVVLTEAQTQNNKKGYVFYTIKNKKLWQSFPELTQTMPSAERPYDVGFFDLDGDKNEDIVFIAAYKGEKGSYIYPIVYRNSGKGFEEDAKLTARLNKNNAKIVSASDVPAAMSQQ